MKGWATHCEMASGYLDLGIPLLAAQSLECIAEAEQQRPEIDFLRLRSLCASGKWAAAAQLAKDASFRHRDNPFIHAVGARVIQQVEGPEAAQRYLAASSCTGVCLNDDGTVAVAVGVCIESGTSPVPPEECP